MFNGQEILMAFFYVRAAYRYLNNGFTKKDKVRNAMCLLIVVSAIVFAVDVFIVSLDISGHMRLKTFLHSFVYTIKLELEFVNLNQLVRISRMGSPGTTSWTSPADIEAQNERVPKRQSGIVTVQRDSAMSMQSWDAVKFITTPKSLSSL